MKDKKPMPKWLKVILWIMIVSVGLVIIACIFGDDIESTPTPENSSPMESAEPSENPEIADEVNIQEPNQTDFFSAELLSIIEAENNVVVVKFKSDAATNKLVIKTTYMNTCLLIQDCGFNKYDEIQIWAVADMTDDSEQKVISFTVPKTVIDTVYNKGDYFQGSTLGDYVTDLWLHPSLSD